MHPLSEAPLAAEVSINAHALATLGIAAVAVWAGWKIFQRLTKK